MTRERLAELRAECVADWGGLSPDAGNEVLDEIERLERERDEARPIVEAAMRQYEAAAPCGWIGAWWLNPAFQTAAIQLHVTCEAAARAAAKENS
jgi:hypothetical protein